MRSQDLAKKGAILLSVFTFLAISHCAVARAQTVSVMVASGNVSLEKRLPGQATNLIDGQILRVGDTVRTGPDGLVILKYPVWSSDQEDLSCRMVVIIGGGNSLRVSRESHPGTCPVTEANARERALRDRPVLSRIFFYDRGGDDKADSPSPVDEGVKSFIEGINGMQQSFKGVLTVIRSDSVRVEASGHPESFVECRKTDRTQIRGAPSLVELKNVNVVLTYILKDGGREAIKIEKVQDPRNMVIERRPPNTN